MALTDTQIANVRRYAGYWASGTTQPVTADNDTVYMIFGITQMSLFKRLTTLSSAEEAILVNYLTQIASLETDYLGATSNLDTAVAAVWTHNPNEIGDRANIYNRWRRLMCAFLGLEPGPGLGDSSIRVLRS